MVLVVLATVGCASVNPEAIAARYAGELGFQLQVPDNEARKPPGGKMEPVGKNLDECGPVVYIDYARFELREYKSSAVLTAAELQRCVVVDWMVDKVKDGMTITTREVVVGGRPALIGFLEGAADPQLLVFQPEGVIARVSAWFPIPEEELIKTAESFHPLS